MLIKGSLSWTVIRQAFTLTQKGFFLYEELININVNAISK